MKVFDLIAHSILIILRLVFVCFFIAIIVGVSWLLGALFSTLFNVNPIIAYLICGTVVTISLLSALFSPTTTINNRLPLAYFVFGWLFGRQSSK